jgi:hypothetical protein
MRVFGQISTAVCLIALVAVPEAQQKPEASAILAQSRQALGGEAKLTAVKNFVVTGRTRRVQGINLVPVEFEIAIEFPDKYVRKDEIPAQESGPTSTGFNGEDVIQLPVPVASPPRAGGPGAPGGAPGAAPAGTRSGGSPPATPPAGGTPPSGATPPAAGATPPASGTPPPAGGTPPAAAPPTGATPPAGAGNPPAGATPPGGRAMGPGAGAPGPAPGAGPGGRAGGPPVDPRKARLYTIKQDFTKLTLGMFAASNPTYPLMFTYVGQAEAPQGKADVIDIKGEGNFALRMYINSQTHLPIMVSWTVPATQANIVMALPGQPPPKDLAPGAIVVEAPALPPATAPKEEQDKYAKDVQALRAKTLASAKPIEHRIYYMDYKDAGNGLMFPFRHRRAIGTDTVEETTFDQFKINTRIDPRKFEVHK